MWEVGGRKLISSWMFLNVFSNPDDKWLDIFHLMVVFEIEDFSVEIENGQNKLVMTGQNIEQLLFEEAN